jgi:hypothetical protein
MNDNISLVHMKLLGQNTHIKSAHMYPMQAWQNGLWEFHLALFLLVTFVAFLDSWHISERHDRARYAPLEKNSAMHACVARAKSTRSQRESTTA